jgi:SAM-dependent methyltransferase
MKLSLETWKGLNLSSYQYYVANGPAGVYSYAGMPEAVIFGKVIAQTVERGKVLDVGCGCLGLPEYMRHGPELLWFGIDPQWSQERVLFKKVAGFGEELPFADGVFDAVVFGTSLDHLLEPRKAITEANRVIKPNGFILIWTAIRDSDEKFKIWKNSAPGSLYDKYHLWAFTEQSILELCSCFQFVERKQAGRSWIYIFKK